MVLKEASWTHGTSIQAEDRSWIVDRYGFYSQVRPSNSNRFSWIHFAIPTPVIINDVRLKAQSAMIRVETGNQAHITSFHVYDGEKKIFDGNGLNITGPMQFIREVIPGTPEVLWGTGISLGVQFDATGPGATGAWVNFVSAGIDFW